MVKNNILKKLVVSISLLAFAINLFACRDDSILEKYEETMETVAPVSLNGTIHLYTSVDETVIMSIKSAFEEKYPNIKLEYVYNDTDTLVPKIDKEYQYDMLECDVMWLDNPIIMQNFKNKDYLSMTDLSDYSDISDDYKDSDNYYVATNIVGLGLAYNDTLVDEKDIPKSLNDLTKEKANGLVMTNPNTAYVSKYFIASLMQNKKYGENYIQKLKDNNISLVDGSLEPCSVVDTAEKGMALAYDIVANRYVDENENFKFRYFDKDNILWYYPIAITKVSVNKGLAKVFLDYVLSEEGQKILKENSFVVVNEKVENYIDTKPLKNKCMKVDIKNVSENFDEYLNKFNGIFGVN